jgi:HSP20 family protein
MALIKTSPMVPSAKRDLEEIVDRFFRNPFASMSPFGLGAVAGRSEEFVPALDLDETEKEFVVRLEVPGIPRENLDVNLVGETLTLSGHRERVERQASETSLWEERESGRFIRTIQLPQAVDPKKIEAVCSDGVLSVHLPKAEPAVKSRIVIKS